MVFNTQLEWTTVDGDINRQGFIRAYCADGDGFVSVEKYANGCFTVLEQGDAVATFTTLKDAIEYAEKYLQENYPHMFD